MAPTNAPKKKEPMEIVTGDVEASGQGERPNIVD